MGKLVDYAEAHRILSKYGINSARSAYIESASDAIKFSAGEPIAMKVISQQALHKSKNGLVKLRLYTAKDISSAFSELRDSARKLKLDKYKILVQEMVAEGVEIIVGGSVDPQFGKMILLGLGGIYVEIFRDVALRVCPIGEYDAESMIHQLRSSNVIAPDKKADAKVKSILLKVSKMLAENEILELDLNPIILTRAGYAAVDLRIIK